MPRLVFKCDGDDDDDDYDRDGDGAGDMVEVAVEAAVTVTPEEEQVSEEKRRAVNSSFSDVCRSDVVAPLSGHRTRAVDTALTGTVVWVHPNAA